MADWLAKLGFVAQGLGVTLLPSLAVGAVRPDVALVPLPGRRAAGARGLRGHLPRPAPYGCRRGLPRCAQGDRRREGGRPRARDRGGTRSGTRRFCPSSGSLVMPPKASPCLSCRRFNRHVVSFCH
nr:hypothetical protein [Streptomyces sp. NBC_01477]